MESDQREVSAVRSHRSKRARCRQFYEFGQALLRAPKSRNAQVGKIGRVLRMILSEIGGITVHAATLSESQ